MSETLKQSWRTAVCGADRAAWIFGWAVALATFVLLITLSTRATSECTVSTLLKIQFTGTNSDSLSPEAYAARGYGWNPMQTELKFVESEFFVRKAIQRLNADASGAKVNFAPSTSASEAVSEACKRLRSTLVPGGIRIRATGRHFQETADLANALARAYRNERNDLAPPPPGCKALSISIAEEARPVRVPPFLWHVCRGALAGLLAGMAGVLGFSGKWMRVHQSAVPVFLFWLCSLFSMALLVRQLTLPQALTGAMLLALLITTTVAGLDFISSKNPPLPRKFLSFSCGIICLLGIVLGLFSRLIRPDDVCASARVRVAVQQPGTPGELLLGYDPRLLATESELIRSQVICDPQVEESTKANLSRLYGHSFSLQQMQQLIRSGTSAEPVPGTSMIDIKFRGYLPQAGNKPQEAATFAKRYQDYWRMRRQTNLAHQINVTILGSAELSDGRIPLEKKDWARALSQTVLNIIFVMSGTFCAALLARNRVHLSILAAFAFLYFCTLGFSVIASLIAPDSFEAACLVRLWPPTETNANSARGRPRNLDATVIQQELALADSEPARSNTLRSLNQSPGSASGRLGIWQKMIDSERRDWLHGHLKVFAIDNTFLLGFLAEQDSAAAAADLANMAAKAYCELPRTTATASRLGPDRADCEIMRLAVPPVRAKPKTNPVADGLANPVPYLLLFMLGVGIGYAGLLLEKVHRARIPARAY